ncbi:NAD(P)-dependent oxidoreductase [Luteimonas fraxinea]|uniref:NAD(P)-dependent oxidoreductase n=1 Tax=Luteimonas fraxinea TaxID=2901869 RepID=A0ABS8UEL2_9GAMM|nr:NAD(P)-dependent oxidoreductase [Luteimonas fraxinea]MCD9097935.1 NAD(P)-dependent oxidoreductase [Luteimonas fraxinea]UHH09332.1 NAD(P)-dependent oxidoreductase [Luteimonas fraxinea]
MQRIALLGITGRAGSRIASELLARGHRVTGIARNTSDTQAQAGLTLQSADASRADAIAPLLQGHDGVVSATRFDGGPTADVLLDAVRQAGVRRLLVVGGAGSLEVAPGVALIDTPEFPEIYEAEAGAGRSFLDTLRGADDIDWTFVSPGAVFEPGTRTGTFRTGGDALLVDADGNSAVSMEDYAIAFADEIEHPAHVRERFSVAY